jgi:hypothetical protein
MPNFLLLGAPRCSTTTLYDVARQHPEIYMSPNKEPCFFAIEGLERRWLGPRDQQGVHDLGEYRRLFEGADRQRIVGEASTIYLGSERAVERARHHTPEAKLVAVLRNPADRAFSHYSLHRSQGREWLTFEDALEAEEGRAALGWSPAWLYREAGLYGRQLERWLEAFPADQLKVFLYDDLKRDYPGVVKELWRFLGVSDFEPGISRWSASGRPRSGRLHAILWRQDHPVKRALRPVLPRRLRQRALHALMQRNVQPAEIDPSTRRELLASYRRDIERTGELLGRDLTVWLDGVARGPD